MGFNTFEERQQYAKKYYLENKNKYKEKAFHCEICNCDFIGHLKRHNTSKKHEKNLAIREKESINKA